jgi:hypothetical protein
MMSVSDKNAETPEITDYNDSRELNDTFAIRKKTTSLST